MNDVAKNGGGEFSQAQKEAIAESFKAGTPEERLEKLNNFATRSDGKVVPIKPELGGRVHGIVAYPGPPRDLLKTEVENKREAPPIELLKRLADPEKSKSEPKVKTIEDAIGEEIRAELKAKGAKPEAEAKGEASFSLRRGYSFKDGRTPLEKSIAALRSLGVRFSYDKFRNRLLVDGHALQFYGESMEYHILVLRTAVNERFGWEARPEVTRAAVVRLCLENSFNPVLDYLDSRVWDGTPRLDTWLSVYLGAADNRLNRAIGRKTLMASVRHVRAPGTKFDQIVVLEGEQGTGKSTVIKILASEDYFSDAEILGLGGREVQELCTGVLLYEIGELEGLGKRDVAHVKAFAVRTHDRARPAYGHMLENRGRTCIFIGTTNSSDYLADDTGNRRFWPVVTHPRPGQVELELGSLKRDRDQLWAEAVVAEATGESLVIDKELWGEAAAVVDARLPDDPWQDILATVENMPNSGGSLERAEGYIKVTSEFLLNGVLCISPEKVNQNHSKRLARVMDRLGWEKPPNIRIGTRVGKGYVKIIK